VVREHKKRMRGGPGYSRSLNPTIVPSSLALALSLTHRLAQAELSKPLGIYDDWKIKTDPASAAAAGPEGIE